MGIWNLERFRVSATKERCREAGMAFTLILILARLFSESEYFLYAALVLLVLTMTAPTIFKSLAAVWFGFSKLLGTILSKIILSVVFFLVVTPVATIRRLMHKDSLRLREFKKSNDSVMDKRNHTFGPMDIEKPF